MERVRRFNGLYSVTHEQYLSLRSITDSQRSACMQAFHSLVCSYAVRAGHSTNTIINNPRSRVIKPTVPWSCWTTDAPIVMVKRKSIQQLQGTYSRESEGRTCVSTWFSQVKKNNLAKMIIFIISDVIIIPKLLKSEKVYSLFHRFLWTWRQAVVLGPECTGDVRQLASFNSIRCSGPITTQDSDLFSLTFKVPRWTECVGRLENQGLFKSNYYPILVYKNHMGA